MQRDLFAPLTRWEIPTGSWSWREGDQIVRVTQGAFCVDLAWPWWTPWQPWSPRTGDTSDTRPGDPSCSTPGRTAHRRRAPR